METPPGPRSNPFKDSRVLNMGFHVRTWWSTPAAQAADGIARMIEAWRGQGAPGTLADLLAADAEERRRRGLPAGVEVYAAAHPALAGDLEACRALLMFELAGLAGEALRSAAARITAALPGLAEEVAGVVSLCEVMAEGEDRPGTAIGKYTLVDRLGSGAFGAVWLARDGELGRYVALKLIHEVPGSGGSVRRVMAEAQAAAGLDHPNVVKIHAAGRAHDGRIYIDAQLVGDADPAAEDPGRVRIGVPLDRAGPVTEGPRPAEWSARTVEAVSRGAAAAHARGVVHRDIKPANIIVTPAGVPMLADFGLSALSGEEREGGITGTPAFMSPEQARGERATPASDIYALGATLRFLLTGDTPIKPTGRHGTQPRTDVLEQLRRGEVRPLEARPGVPARLARICDRAMARDPRDRYESAGALADDLAAWRGHRPTAAGREGVVLRVGLWYRRHAAVATVVLAGVAAVAAVGVRGYTRVVSEKDRAVAAEASAEFRRKEAENARLLAEEKRKEAEDAREVAEGVNRFMQQSLLAAQVDRTGDGRAVTMYEAIAAAAGDVEATVGDQPLVEAGVRHVIGRVFSTMGDFREAERHLRRSLEVRTARLGPEHPETLYTRFALAEMLSYAERTPEAAEIIDSLSEAALRKLGRNALLTRSVRELTAQVRAAQGRLDEARAIAESLLEGATAEEARHAERQLGHIAKAAGDRAGAVRHFERAMAAGGAEGVWSMGLANDLGSVLAELGETERAEPLLRPAYAWFKDHLGPGHVNTLNAGYNLAWMLLVKKKDGPGALAVAQTAAPAAEKALTPGNLVAVRWRVLEGRAQAASGKDAQAEATLRAAVPRAEALGEEGVALDAIASRTLAACLKRLGRAEEAAEWQTRGDRKAEQARHQR